MVSFKRCLSSANSTLILENWASACLAENQSLISLLKLSPVAAVGFRLPVVPQLLDLIRPTSQLPQPVASLLAAKSVGEEYSHVLFSMLKSFKPAGTNNFVISRKCTTEGSNRLLLWLVTVSFDSHPDILSLGSTFDAGVGDGVQTSS